MEKKRKNEYRSIKNELEAAAFLSEANGLHDGYIVSANYQHQGYTWGNPLYIDPQKTKLVLRIMVTSICDTLVEMIFEDIQDLQIKDVGYDLLDSSISFSGNGFVTWCGDLSTDPESLRNSNYVISKTMKWKIVSQ